MIDVATVERYLDEISVCTTLNQFNRVHVRIETYASPEEVAAIIDGVKARRIELIVNLQRWHAIMEDALRGHGRKVQPYVRATLAPGAAMFSAPGTPEEIARRTLVIAFTGNADRLMMPLAMFLQHCPADANDVLVLYDRSRRFFLAGVDGFATDLPDSVDEIRRRIDLSRYRHCVAFGCSGGGLAAVWAAVELGLPRAVSIGGATPHETAQSAHAHNLDTSGFRTAIRERGERLPEVLYVAGEGASRDRAKGLAMREYLPTRQLIVPGCAEHNTLFHLRRQGSLDRFLEVLLDARDVGALGPMVVLE